MTLAEALGRRWRGEFTVDAFGLDVELHDAAVRLGRLRWNVILDGAEHIPVSGPALLVVQRRIGISEQAVVAVGVATETDRRVHSAGIPGVTMAEAPLRRIGATLAHPAETTAMLRDGHLVSVGLGWAPVNDEPGPISPDLVAPPLSWGVPVLPVVLQGREWGRTWRVRIGSPVDVYGHGDHFTPADATRAVRGEVRRLARGLREG